MSKLTSACLALLIASFLAIVAYVPGAQGKPQGGKNYWFQNNSGKFYDLLIDSSTNISFRLTGNTQRMLGLVKNTQITNGYYVISRTNTKNYEDMRAEVFAAAQNDKLNLWVQCSPQPQRSDAVVDYLILSPDLPQPAD